MLEANAATSKNSMKMKTNRILSLFVATGAILVTAASLRASDRSPPPPSPTCSRPIKDDSIKTVYKDGIVTLTGTVSEQSHKVLAQDTVQSLPGVKSVDNQLKVSGEQPAEHSDTWISMKVKSTLLFHRNVSATGTKVYVKDGIVTLQGEASSLAQKELTTEYAKDIDNVKEVKNEMMVAKTVTAPGTTTGDNVDDASITAEVKAALLSRRSTCALHPQVSTKDGAVTLSGIAQNDAQKSLVARLVADLNGVTSVINNMTEDASITAEVQSALQSEGATSVLHITVSTTDGAVSLSGMAKNDAGKSLAAKLATDINGVTRVINNMTVEVVAAPNPQ
jgi:osmotically-inducible protein OsmY